MNDRTCAYCDEPLPANARSDQRFCSRSHKSAARKQRRHREKIRASLVAAGLPFDKDESRENDGGHLPDRHAAAARFRAMVAADAAARVPKTQEREWAAYARRHGTIHPDEQAARTARGTQERADDWQQGTARFQRPQMTLAEQARSSRARQRQPVLDSGPVWDDDDPDLMEPPQMITGSIYKTGYRHAGIYR